MAKFLVRYARADRATEAQRPPDIETMAHHDLPAGHEGMIPVESDVWGAAFRRLIGSRDAQIAAEPDQRRDLLSNVLMLKDDDEATGYAADAHLGFGAVETVLIRPAAEASPELRRNAPADQTSATSSPAVNEEPLADSIGASARTASSPLGDAAPDGGFRPAPPDQANISRPANSAGAEPAPDAIARPAAARQPAQPTAPVPPPAPDDEAAPAPQPPEITSAAEAGFAENGAGVVYQATGVSHQAGSPLVWSLAGADAGLFRIDAATGDVRFLSLPDFETPTDQDGDNLYDLVLRADDGATSVEQALVIRVADLDEAPSITSSPKLAVDENGAGHVYAATALDPEGAAVKWSIAGADAGLFDIDAATGALTFRQSPDHEAPADRDRDNVYDIVVQAHDGNNVAEQAVAIHVQDLDEAPSITSASFASVDEEMTGAFYTATSDDPAAKITWSVSGLDGAMFEIDAATGELRFAKAPDHEAPADKGADNQYDVIVQASDGRQVVEQALTIRVDDVNERPSIVSDATAVVDEQTTGIFYKAAASDPDAGTSLKWSISGADAALFRFNSATGELAFSRTPDYEAPADQGRDNVYDVILTASDGALDSEQALSIRIDNINEAPVDIIVNGASAVRETVSSGGSIGTAYSAAATQPVVATLSATDPDGGALRFDLVDSANGRFELVNGNQLRVAAGAGFDYESASSHRTTIRVTDAAGESYSEVLEIAVENYQGSFKGGDDQDSVAGTSEEDVIYGGGGNDLVAGGAGADRMDGGEGVDTVDYSASVAGVNVDLNNAGAQKSNGDAAGDMLSGFENITGSKFSDVLTGDDAANDIRGGVGADTLNGGGGNDLLSGGAGADKISGGEGFDIVDYSASATAVTVDLTRGADQSSKGDADGDILTSIEGFIGSKGDDKFKGDGRDNSFAGGAGADEFVGGDGSDTADYSASKAGVTVDLSIGGSQKSAGDASGDKLSEVENVTGSAFDDKLTGDKFANSLSGGDGRDSLSGGDGSDLLAGGRGADQISGGAGDDTADYSLSDSGVSVNLQNAGAQESKGDAAGDVLSGVENLTGSAFDDVLTGDKGANLLSGGAGDDWFEGVAGADILLGGDGSDYFLLASDGAGTSINGGRGWTDTIDVQAFKADFSGDAKSSWTLVLTSGEAKAAEPNLLVLSEDSSGYLLSDSGAQIGFAEIEQIRW
ncbi:MAG: hypothetical protein Q7T73_01310 [Beijerinckiaceae bacterium]|nr:hypothetical protein [Beijerinckiaceae bacterium]